MRSGARICVVAAMVLCACGGGGGDGGGAGDGGLVVTPTSLTFTYVIGGAVPSFRAVSATWTSPAATMFGVALPQGVLMPSWLTVSATGWGRSGTATIGVNPASATVGTKTVTLLVGIGNDAGVIAYREVLVTFVVKVVGPSTDAVSPRCVFGSSAPPDAETVYAIAPTPTAWTASADRAWIHLSATSGTTTSPVILSFDPAGLGTGVQSGTVTFSIGSEVSTVTVTLTVALPTLTVTPGTVALAGLGGHDLSPKRVEVSLDTGSNAYPFTVATTDGWLALASSVTTASATPESFTVRPAEVAAAWPAGTHQGTVTVRFDVNGLQVSKEIPVSYALDQAKLLVEADGVALTSTPALSRLSRTLRVATNRGTPVNWRATSDRPWLDATPLGTTGPLVLTADPTGLATGMGGGSVYVATVTVTASDPGLASATETVRVGLWVGAATPDPVSVLGTPFVAVATDPVRPYAYLTDGGPSIRPLNVYTGALGAISVPGTTLRALAVSSDGARLFALDGTAHQIVPIDLATWTPGAPWPSAPLEDPMTTLAFARTNGVGVVISSAGVVRSATTGAVLAQAPNLDDVVVASRNGSRFCTLMLGGAPYTFSCRALDVTTLAGDSIVLGPEERAFGPGWGGQGQDLALSPDGTRAFVAAEGTYAFSIYDPTSGSIPLLGGLGPTSYRFPTAVDVGADGRVYCATAAEPDTLSAYEPSGAFLGSAQIGPVRPGLFRVSGDGLRAVVGTTEYTSTALELVTLPAF
jgi:hypothetical protein